MIVIYITDLLFASWFIGTSSMARDHNLFRKQESLVWVVGKHSEQSKGCF